MPRVRSPVDAALADLARIFDALGLVAALTRKHFALRVSDSAGFVEKTRVLPVVHRATSMLVDIVFAGPGLEDLFLEPSARHRRGRLSIPIASAEDLIVIKILAGRFRTGDRARHPATAKVIARGAALSTCASESSDTSCRKSRPLHALGVRELVVVQADAGAGERLRV